MTPAVHSHLLYLENIIFNLTSPRVGETFNSAPITLSLCLLLMAVSTNLTAANGRPVITIMFNSLVLITALGESWLSDVIIYFTHCQSCTVTPTHIPVCSPERTTGDSLAERGDQWPSRTVYLVATARALIGPFAALPWCDVRRSAGGVVAQYSFRGESAASRRDARTVDTAAGPHRLLHFR